MTGTTRTSPRTADASTSMRPPDAGAAGTCLNCGEALSQRFCSACGQAAIDPNPTLGEFVHEAASEFRHWDGKLAATFRLLFSKPGELTREYLAGRRASFLSPLRLYLTRSVIFFALKAFAPEPPFVVRAGTTQVGVVTIQEDTVGATLEAVDGRRMRYPQHLAFALHTHAFLFLALVLTLVPRVTRNAAVDAIAVGVSFLVIAVYVVLAVRRVYGGSLRGAIVRSGALALTYFVVFTAAMLLTFAVAALRV